MTETKELNANEIKQQEFLRILFDKEIGGDPQLAKELAGYNEHYPVSRILATLKDEIVQRTKDYLVINGPKAAKELVGVFADPSNKGAKNTIAAAVQVLDRIGVIKEEPEPKVQEGPVSVIIIPAKTAQKIEDLCQEKPEQN